MKDHARSFAQAVVGEAPYSLDAERSVVGTLLARPEACAEIVPHLEARQFYSSPARLLYGAIVKRYYENVDYDPLTLAEAHAAELAKLMVCADVHEVPARIRATYLDSATTPSTAREHAKIIRRHAERRELLDLARQITNQIQADSEPEVIAAGISQRAMQIATQTVDINEALMSFGDAGRRLVTRARFERAARLQGIELGVYTGIAAIDDFTKGLRPGRLYIAGGEPGVGKTAVFQRAALNFAERQAARQPDQRIGTLFLSLEMGEEDATSRFASMLTGIEGDLLAEARVTDAAIEDIVREWSRRRDMPFFLNFAPVMSTSQMLALISEAIRRHNVGLVVIDHFRQFNLDKRLENQVQEDEEKARFLSADVARGLNVAVVCLAHTRKPDAAMAGGRPQMADLRGSYQIQAYCNYLAFLYRPALYATERELESGEVSFTDAELIYRKNRHSRLGTGALFFDAEHMHIQ